MCVVKRMILRLIFKRKSKIQKIILIIIERIRTKKRSLKLNLHFKICLCVCVAFAKMIFENAL